MYVYEFTRFFKRISSCAANLLVRERTNERKCENRLNFWIASSDKYPKNKLEWEKEIRNRTIQRKQAYCQTGMGEYTNCERLCRT